MISGEEFAKLEVKALAQNSTVKAMPLSDDFAKAALKAIFALHDFHGGEADASRVKGLMEDAEIAASTEGDTAEMHMISVYAAYLAAWREIDRLDDQDKPAENQSAWMAALKTTRETSLEMITSQHLAVGSKLAPEFFDSTSVMLKSRKAVFFTP